MPEDPRMMKAFRLVTLETGAIAGLAGLGLGLGLLIAAVHFWQETGFGRLDYAQTMRWVIPGATLTALGFQTLLSSFFISVLGMKRK